MPVVLLRHAHAVSRSDWDGRDRDRPLSKGGRRQADRLVPRLSAYEPKRILSSPYLRCMDTVVPLSGSVGVGVEAEDLLAEGSGRAALDLVRSLAGSSSVLCSHGDIIPELLAALANEDGIELGRHPRWEKASAWVLRSSGDRLVSAEYLPPPSREADA